MTTATLDQTLDLIRAAKGVRCVNFTREPMQGCVRIIADATWDASLHRYDEDFFGDDTKRLKERIFDALYAQKYNHRSESIFVWTGDAGEGLIEWVFTER